MERSQTLASASLLLLISSSLFFTSSALPRRWRPPQFLGRFARLGVSNRATYQYEERYFRQPLDHFSFADLPSFQQRYLIAGVDAWALPSGPIFFYCGNEGDIEWFAANTGFVWDIAPRFSALIVFAEVGVIGSLLNIFALVFLVKSCSSGHLKKLHQCY